MNLETITADKDPALNERAQNLVDEAFPPFANHSPIINRFWSQLCERWSDWQIVLRDLENDTPLVLANCFPLRFDGSLEDLPEGGVEWALAEAVAQDEAEIKPNVACAFQIVIANAAQGRGLSYKSVEIMRDLIAAKGMTALIAPVRPNRKERYPDMPFDEYVAWRREDGQPFDDWLRVHKKLGGRIGPVCERSFVVEGSIDDWEKWTGERFTTDGPHVVAGGLGPVEVDLSANCAIYAEPNIWVWHGVGI